MVPQELPIKKQLGMNVWIFRAIVVVEYLILALVPFQEIPGKYAGPIVMSILYGIFCIDMSVFVLELFQSYLDFHNGLTRFLANGAYGAYLVHLITVTLAVAIFVWMYNGEPSLIFDYQLVWVSSTEISITTLVVAGLIYAALIWVPLTWLIACALRKLPGLKHVL